MQMQAEKTEGGEWQASGLKRVKNESERGREEAKKRVSEEQSRTQRRGNEKHVECQLSL